MKAIFNCKLRRAKWAGDGLFTINCVPSLRKKIFDIRTIVRTRNAVIRKADSHKN